MFCSAFQSLGHDNFTNTLNNKMKRLTAVFILACCCYHFTHAQIKKGNVLVGGDISQLSLSTNTGNNFSFTIDPKAAWFIKDNLAVGGFINFQLVTAKGAGTGINYGIGPLARYYISDPSIEVLRRSRFFIEGNIGIQGTNPQAGASTNGLGIGFGPGLAYFVTPNIGLETLLKWNPIIGFGSAVASSTLTLGVGFQVYLPKRTVTQAENDIERKSKR
jgi:hypothetical protein